MDDAQNIIELSASFDYELHFAQNFDFDKVAAEFPYDISSLTTDKTSDIYKAALFAFDAHKGQVRKYTGEPYIEHPIEVANLVKTVLDDSDAICAALMHDVVEDTERTLRQIRIIFGDSIAVMVEGLTDVAIEGNRAERKEADRKRIAKACWKTKTVKLGDLISNTRSIVNHDPNFAKVYLSEKGLLLEVLTEGNSELYEQAVKHLIDGRLALMQGCKF